MLKFILKVSSVFIFLILSYSQVYANCTVNGTSYRTNSDTSGTYITLSNLTSRASSWNNSTDLVTTCDVSQFTSMYRAFRNNSSFNQDISAWDVSNVTNMNGMFQSATSLTSVSFSDTSSVTDMSFMFASTTNLTSVSLSDTSNVTDMSYMFYFADAFNVDISSWNTSKVTNMKAMFQVAESFNQDISSWNTSNVTDMSGLFSRATAFNQNINSWDTSNVTDMSLTFERTTAFNQSLSNWNTSNVTDMAYMFSYAVAFNQDISGWDTSNVTDMEYMFYKDAAFNQDIGNWDTSNVTNMTLMFSYAVAFNQNIRRWNVSSATAFTDMFTNATLMQSTYSGVTGFGNTPTSSWFDSTVPTMVITASQVSDGDTSNDGTLSMTFTSSEATNNFVVGDITVVGGALSNFAASSSTVYTATFTPTASGVTTIDVASAAFTDLVGNNNTAATQYNWTYDGTTPTLSSVSIVTNNAITSVANNGDVVTLTLTASETINTPVVTFKSGGAAITDTSVTYTNASGNTWTAAYTANASDTFGAVTFSIAYSDTVGNAATITSTTDSTSVSFMPTPSAAFAAVKADVESKMAANARTQLNDFTTSTSSIVGSARSRFMNASCVADSSDTALSGDVSSDSSDLKGSTKRVTSTGDCKNTSIIEVQYQYTETKEGLKSQNASGQIINEAKLSDSLTFGRFLGASLGDGEAIGTSNIDIDFIGAQAGAYLVGNTKGGLVYDTYFAGSVIENKMGVTTSLMTADSKYYSSMLTTGASITGKLQVKKVEIRPTLSTDLSYMFRETADFDVNVGPATSVEQAAYGDISKAQITFAPEFRLPFGESSVITATPNVMCRYLKQGTATEDCGQGLSLGFQAKSTDELKNLIAKAGMDRIGSETTSTIKLQFEKRF